MPKKTITFTERNGTKKVVEYKDLHDLRKKLYITYDQAYELDRTQGNATRVIVGRTGNVEKYNINQRPLILRNFGIKKISTKSLMGVNKQMGLNTIFKSIPAQQNINVMLDMTISFRFSEDFETRHPKLKLLSNVSPMTIDERAQQEIQNYIDNGLQGAYEIQSSYKIRTIYTHKVLDLLPNMRLREEEPLDISNIWSGIDINKTPQCAKVYLKKKLCKGKGNNKMSPKTIDALGNDNGITCQEIIDFCQKYRIGLTIFQINGQCLHQTKSTNKSYASLHFIAYNNHLYPSKYANLIPKKHKNVKIEIVPSAHLKFMEFLGKGIVGGDIKITGKENGIASFIIDSVKYLQNDDYVKCQKILQIYGLEDKIEDNISLGSLFEILVNKRIPKEENTVSFWPQANRFKKAPFIYKTNEKFNPKTVKMIDKNKMYSFCLEGLPYILTTDYRTSEITEKPTEIINHYLYIVKPEKSSILLPTTNVYWGEFLNFCKQEGLEFTILEEMTCAQQSNSYSQLIREIYDKVDNKDAKKICNIGIGKFEQTESQVTIIKDVHLFNKEECKYHSAFPIDINDKFVLHCEAEREPVNLYNRKPISIQIKDMSRWHTYQKCKQMGSLIKRIIQINTDSIAYEGEYPPNLGDGFDQWKKQPFKQIYDTPDPIDNDIRSFCNERMDDTLRVIAECHAGSGKTYEIINTRIPSTIASGKTYRVLTPSHASLIEYRAKGLNCDVIQKYEFGKTTPDEEVIFIDEVGMCSRRGMDVIYKCARKGKEIHAYGDFNQLAPVDGKGKNVFYNSSQFLEYLFNERVEMNTNHRNNFTIEYYDQLINEDINFKDEVKKHSTKNFEDAEYILCWFNKTVNIYNEMKLKQLGLKPHDVGVKLLCRDNELRKLDIYNQFEMEIEQSNDDGIKLKGVDHIFTPEQINKHFTPGYARTAYGVQSKSIKSYYWAPEDTSQLDGRTAYVIISRLRTK